MCVCVCVYVCGVLASFRVRRTEAVLFLFVQMVYCI